MKLSPNRQPPSNAKKFILDIIFPVSCVSCGRNDEWICADCLSNIELLSFQVCPSCEKIITDHGKVCTSCRPFSFLDGLVSATKYQEKTIAKLVHLLKYKFIPEIATPLGAILTKIIQRSELPLPDFVIPVPLHPRRLRWRGFNQSELLARHVSENLAPGYTIPLLTQTLARKKYTSPQMHLKNYDERKENIRDSFEVRNGNPLKNERILLIDDISTTGATLFECAKTLKKAGAKEVFAAVIARQEILD